MDKLKTKIRNVFKGSKTKKGFSLMELIVVIAIMVIMLAVLAPSLIHYVEDTRAKKDTSASSEMTNAVTMGLTNQDVYDELIKNSVKGNVSCYIDSPTEEGYEKIESSSKYTFDDNARLLDEVPYHPAGNMYGVTITFEPKQKANGSDTEYSLKDGIVNKYVPEKTQLLSENENLYAALRKVVGEKVELNSQTYRNSELTIFVQVGSRKGSDIITTDAVEVYSQFSGTNLPANTEIEYTTTTDRVIDYVYDDPDEPIGGGTGGSGTLPDGGGSGTTGGNTEHTHSYEKQVTSPTCQNQGYTTYVCTCGDSYVDEESYVDKVGHSYASTIEKYATCTATGTKSLRCSICGHNETAEIAKLGHSYKDDVIEATCTTNGYTIHTCSRCGDTYQDNQTVAGGHQWSDWTVTKESDCKNEGFRNRKCNLCGHQENETVSALGHNYNNVVTEPTCTTEGYTTHTCSKCGDVYTDSKTDKKNHTFGDWTTNKEPSCEVAGERFRICTTCSQTEYSTINQLGHDYKDDYTTDIAATCTTVGRKSQHCSRCNSTRNNIEIPALGHSWNSGSETIKPTCENAGTKVYTCNTCGATKSEDLNATGHNYKETVTPPTTTSEGYTLHTCLNCGLSYKDNFVDKIGVSITGTVKIIEELMHDVKIQLEQNDTVIYTATTDENGAFSITDMYVGEYNAVITYKEVNQWSQIINVNADGEKFDFSFLLAPGLYDSENNLLISWENLTSMDYYTIPEYEKYVGYDDETYEDIYEIVPESPIINVTSEGKVSTSYDDYNGYYYSAEAIMSLTDLGMVWDEENQQWLTDENGDYVYNVGKLIVDSSVKHVADNGLVLNSWDKIINMIFLPDEILTIGNSAFGYDVTINKMPSSVTTIGSYAFSNITLLDTAIPKSVTSIDKFAFENSNLTEINIHENVTYIGGLLNSKATKIMVDNNNLMYDSRNNCNAIMEIETDVLIMGCVNTVIPNDTTGIYDYAFYDVYKDINLEITIPNQVSFIGKNSFANNQLKTITIPSSVKSIGEESFYRVNVNELNIENGLESIGNNAFFWLNTKQVLLPDSVVNVGDSIFMWSYVNHVKWSKNAIVIPSSTFSSCDDLTNIEIPEGVEVIGSRAFDDCNLQTLNIPSSIITIETRAFDRGFSGNELIIPGNVKTIGQYAFEDCRGLKKLIINEGVQKIGYGAFYCNSYVPDLNYISVPSSLTNANYTLTFDRYEVPYYNKQTGQKYAKLDDVPRGVAAIYVKNQEDISGVHKDDGTIVAWTTLVNNGDLIVTNGELVAGGSEGTENWCGSGHVFAHEGTLIIDDSITSIGSNAFGCSVCPGAGKLTLVEEVIIPDSVTSIGDGAFGNCASIKSIVIGDGVTSIKNIFGYSNYGTALESITIGKNVNEIAGASVSSSSGSYIQPMFNGFGKLKEIVVDGENNTYCSVNGVLFNKSQTTLLEYPDAKSDTSYSIPNSVTNVSAYAFSGADNIETLVIPTSMVSIGNYAFAGLSGLKSVEIPNTIVSIGNDGFSSCGMESIIIPGNVKTIGQTAFGYCDNLKTIKFEEGVKTINKWVLYDCESLQEINIPSSVSYIGNGIASYCKSLTQINVDENNNYYCSENGILYNENKTKMIQYPCGKTDTTFTIPSHVTTIGERAMLGTEYIKTLIIPSTVTRIEASACSYGQSLYYIYFEHTTSFPSCGSSCFWSSGHTYTFYFKNSTMYSKLTTSHYWSSYGTKSTNYSW